MSGTTARSGKNSRPHRRSLEASEPPHGLTKNERLVWNALAAAGEPLKAYEILDRLKERGVRAPMTVYRALDGLEEKGAIHKLDGLNAFVLCNQDGMHDVQAFLVCERCATVTEIEIDGVAAGVGPALNRTGFDMRTARLEVRGYCRNCAAPS
ncbi:Fur family transcriptional regulator [Amphiplicatus metriothermophilus]|uniref:Fur family transcriptional regulator, zinc uptake regulator n=1 Tax=Amphiplicatus metriothermophilus TaxID=1519374 RepID=A0A239PJ34_9PROT|nr:Fur family transcriptional regulator [Amphiplicatus metriothermophilus]MBB5517878.1 Fur family zinc uptake transcriptional regulator [Amphiplicatus metriothermophilus]SNT67788.1 Fur family transcriptional regulator, zinc uptake regulator [Amphiplicatus metriothermophilus]